MPRPTQQDLEARAEAIKEGKTRYVRPSDNQEWVIRNLDNPRLQRRFGGQGGTDEQATMRKGNRGGGTEGARKQAEALATPDPMERRAADQEMARMRSRGNVGHHGLPVSALAAGEREKPGTMAAYERVHGKENVGHRPGALVEMTPEAHSKLHNVQETAYFQAIRRAGSQADALFRELAQLTQQLTQQKRKARFGIPSSTNPTSPLNRNSAAYGGIETQTNLNADSRAVDLGFKLAN